MPEHVQQLSRALFLNIVEHGERQIAVRDGTKVDDFLRCELRGTQSYFLARVNEMFCGVATIAITHVDARFWSKVDRSGGKNACWPWLCGVDKDGYGKFQYGPNGKQIHVRAHNFALELMVPRTGPLAMHFKCDNPPCCNWTHLKWGTQTENRADCTAKGRNACGDQSGPRMHPEAFPRGETHYRAKLKDCDVVDLRSRFAAGESLRSLATRFGICFETAWALAHYKYRKDAK